MPTTNTQRLDTLELFKHILSLPSITPDDAGGMDFLEQYLSDFECIKLDQNGVKNRLFYKHFAPKGKGVHLCFAGHIDVVPTGEGWASDPFVPTIAGDTITARGAQDMKSGLCAFTQALKDTKTFNGTLSMLVTSDEEGPAKYGTVEMLRHLKSIDFLPDFAVVGEPTCEKQFGDMIKVGRRGSINALLTIKGKQGHAAYPAKAINPVHQIAPLLGQIAGKNLDEGDAYFEPSQIVITDIRGGLQVSNVTPGDLVMMLNVRNSTKTTQESMRAYLDEVLQGLDYALDLTQGAYPFLTNASSDVVGYMQASVQKHLAVAPTLGCTGGTSDARFLGEFGVDTVEFGVKNDTIHAKNESTSISDYLALKEVYQDLIGRF